MDASCTSPAPSWRAPSPWSLTAGPTSQMRTCQPEGRRPARQALRPIPQAEAEPVKSHRAEPDSPRNGALLSRAVGTRVRRTSCLGGPRPPRPAPPRRSPRRLGSLGTLGATSPDVSQGCTSTGGQCSADRRFSKALTRGGPAADNLAHQSNSGLDHIHSYPNMTVTCPDDSRQDKRKGTGSRFLKPWTVGRDTSVPCVRILSGGLHWRAVHRPTL